MLKRALLLTVLALLLALPVTTNANVPIDDLIALGENFPADTGLFFAIRADDDYIDTIDSVLAEFDSAVNLPPTPDFVPASTRNQGRKDDFTPTRDMLNEFAEEFFGGDFETTMRPWLGDSAAFGITDFATVFEVGVFDNADAIIEEGEFPIIMALEVTDADGAADAADAALGDELDPDITLRIEAGVYTYYQAREVELGMLISPTALLFGRPSDLLDAIDRPRPTLLENESFTETMSLLLEDDYNSIMYVDYQQLIREGVLSLDELDPSQEFSTAQDLALFDEVIDTVEGLAVGATLLDDRTLTLDIVQNADYSSLQDTGFALALPLRLNPEFAERIPASAGLVLMSSDFAGLYDASIENLRVNARLFEDMENPPEGTFSESDIDGVLFAVGFFLRRYTGLDLEDDILSWMDGDYAVAIGLTDEVSQVNEFFDLTAIPLDFILLFDATTNPESAADTVTGIARAIDDLLEEFESDLEFSEFDVSRSDETIADTDVVVYTIIDESGFSFAFPIEILLAANEDVFVIGSRTMVETALRGDGGLRDTVAFQEAEESYLVDEAGILMLVNSEALLPFADVWTLSDPFSDLAEREAAVIRSVLNLVSSATISGSNAEDGVGVSRATISLNLSADDE